jgi:acyl CoA:acetate/3-ketoacid CoA transferase beta subunit
MPWTREDICKIAALELKDGYYCNLGIGMPTKVANYIPGYHQCNFAIRRMECLEWVPSHPKMRWMLI